MWERLPESLGPTWGLRLSADAGARSAFLLVAGDCFLFAADRPGGAALTAVSSDDVLASSRLGSLLATDPALSASLDAKRGALRFEASHGRVAAGWVVELSTVPEQVGAQLGLGAGDMPDGLVAASPLALGAFPPEGGWTAVRDDGDEGESA